jgi:hypothetical protein
MTTDDITTVVRGERAAERQLATHVLRSGRNPLINLALQHGWSRSLEDLLRDAARQRRDRDGELPTTAQMEQFRMGTDDVLYYQAHGQSLHGSVLEAIVAERQRLGLWHPVCVELSADRRQYRIVLREAEDRRQRPMHG